MHSIIQKSKFVPDYLVYRLTAKSSAGHGIHSPFVFQFAKDVVSETTSSRVPEIIELVHREQLLSQKLIETGGWGAGSNSLEDSATMGRMVKSSSVSPKLGGLLYRVCQWANPKYILEIGTSVGVSTMYLAAANPKARVVTIEGNPNKIAIAKENFQRVGLNNITIQEGDFEFALEEAISLMPRIDLVFFDGNHRSEPTLRYFKQCSDLKHENSIFIFDDIRWSQEMYNTWRIIRRHKSISISIDLFNVGIVFFREGIAKQHFTINF